MFNRYLLIVTSHLVFLVVICQVQLQYDRSRAARAENCEHNARHSILMPVKLQREAEITWEMLKLSSTMLNLLQNNLGF